MELRDFIVTPIWLIIVYATAYWVRPLFTDHNTRRYFIPALTVRIIGAIAVGMVYQFYYNGGDTFTYHTGGSAIVWQALMDMPSKGIQLLFAGNEDIPELYKYTKQIWYFGDMSSYFIVRVASIFDLFTFRSYSATAMMFAILSFTGAWALFQVFYRRFNNLHKYLAIAMFYIPSVYFWGSGILKDSITLAAVGWATYSFDMLFFQKRKILINVVLLIIALYTIIVVKVYIILCLIPALVIWIYRSNMRSIRPLVLKVLIAPVILAICFGLAYWAVLIVGQNNPKYAIENIAKTSQVTAYDIRYGWGARNGIGSGYELGELDGDFKSMLKLLPDAINVSLFRPYLWEIQNPLMMLAAIESLLVLILTIVVLYKTKIVGLVNSATNPIVLFSLTFSLIFAFAVGVSTYNFGTLMRYKIPLMPFYIASMFILIAYSNKDKKLA